MHSFPLPLKIPQGAAGRIAFPGLRSRGILGKAGKRLMIMPDCTRA
jgi:hypothetical protein